MDDAAGLMDEDRGIDVFRARSGSSQLACGGLRDPRCASCS
jgi:hypothetical protein